MIAIMIPIINLLMMYLGIYLLSLRASTQAVGYILILGTFLLSIYGAIFGSRKYLISKKNKEKAFFCLLSSTSFGFLTYFVIVILEILVIPIVGSFVR